MNTRKLVTGGLAAGLLLNLLNIVAQVMLGSRMVAEVNSWIQVRPNGWAPAVERSPPEF